MIFERSISASIQTLSCRTSFHFSVIKHGNGEWASTSDNPRKPVFLVATTYRRIKAWRTENQILAVEYVARGSTKSEMSDG